MYVVAAEVPAGGRVLPACWALLPDKKAVSYKKLWGVISSRVGICPETAIFDMEKAATSTFMAEFEGAKVRI